jgi:hypothetical protein
MDWLVLVPSFLDLDAFEVKPLVRREDGKVQMDDCQYRSANDLSGLRVVA